VTLPHPDLPVVLLSHGGRCRSSVTSRAAVPAAAAPAAGIPVVLNASLNLRGEPIVHRLTEAVADFLRSDMDALFLGSLLFE
jgi:Carbamoyltransferase C-terminus